MSNRSRNDEKHEVTFLLLWQTDSAYKVKEADNTPEFWLPKSQLEKVHELKLGTILQAEVPEWLLIEKGVSGF